MYLKHILLVQNKYYLPEYMYIATEQIEPSLSYYYMYLLEERIQLQFGLVSRVLC